jgi:hypothetical protein
VLSTFPGAWLLLTLPFASAAVIGRARPLRQLSARHHRIMFSLGAVGLFAFLAGLAGLLPTAWTLAGVIFGGAVSGFACFWPARPDEGGDDWRRGWSVPEDDPPPPGRPDTPIDWHEFDRVRAAWERRPRVGR